ncbi:MAG: dihydroorotase [Bacteroidota bacterium]
MKTILKKAKIFDYGAPWHGQKRDILIDHGVVRRIEETIEDEGGARIISSSSLAVSAGWCDLKANFRDPGEEFKEDLDSGTRAALAGGFSYVGIATGTEPVIDNKSQVSYISGRNTPSGIVELIPQGAISKGLIGNQLAEMYDMHRHGVTFFNDDQKCLSAGLLYRALLYTKNFDSRVVSFPMNYSMIPNGQVNEGLASMKTGLNGIPAIGEAIQIQRDLRLLEYTEGKLHFTGISTEESVRQIQAAKSKGLNVTCDVHAHQLLFTEAAVLGFDTQHKVMPPLRTQKDQDALWKGLEQGTIDAIVSNHQPETVEFKNVEFDRAAFGNSSIQSIFSALVTARPDAVDTIVQKLSCDARKLLLGKDYTGIALDQEADITVFDTRKEWHYTADLMQSKSANDPFLDQKLRGKVLGVIKGNFDNLK